jgi:oligopeptide transport system substrate-binding protein
VGVDALDDVTLEIRLREPAGYFDVVATSLASVAQPRWQIEAYDEEWTATGNFQGYGPYVLKEWVHGSHLTLVKNPHWPGTESIPRPTIEEITWTLMDDADALLAAYRAGDFDAIQVPPENLDAVRADSHLQEHLVVQPEPFIYYYGFNTVETPFDDPRVRRAFSLAVDRQALVGEVVPGNHRPARWFSPPGPRAVPTAEEYPSLGIAYDPDEAIELLDSVYPNRAQMPSILLASTSYGIRSEIAETVRMMWKETLEVDVDLELFDDFGDYMDRLDEDTPQLWGMGQYPEQADAHYFLDEMFHSGADVQYTHWSNDVFDALVDQAARSTDTEARMGWYAEAEDILVNQDAVVIPLYWHAESVLTQPYIYRTYSQIGTFGRIERFETWAVLEH